MAIQGAATGVICKRCKTPVEVQAAEQVGEEFSVRCPQCGHREFYRVKALKTLSDRGGR